MPWRSDGGRACAAGRRGRGDRDGRVSPLAGPLPAFAVLLRLDGDGDRVLAGAAAVDQFLRQGELPGAADAEQIHLPGPERDDGHAPIRGEGDIISRRPREQPVARLVIRGVREGDRTVRIVWQGEDL